MTREEAIKLLEHISIAYTPTDAYGDYDDPQPYEDALNMAIEAMQNETVHDRLIDADALMEYCSNQKTKTISNNDIARFPTIQADRSHGEWVDEDGNKVPLDKDGYPLGSCWCNQCHEWLVGSDEYAIKGNFCPSCGVKMKGSEEG